MQANNAQLAKYLNTNTGELKDPTDDIIARLNELMFRAGVASTGRDGLAALTDEGLSIEQTLLANQKVTQNV